MAKMREKNEAIRKRYNEVQEDLKNAQTISSQVKVESGSEDEDKKPARKVVNKTPPRENSKKFTPRRQTSEPNDTEAAGNNGGAEPSAVGRPVHAFGEGEGPPPDPGYNFLADEERDGPKDGGKEGKEQKEKIPNKNNPVFSGPGRGGTGGSFKRGGNRFPRQRGGQRGGRQFSNDDFGRPSRDGGMPDKDQKWRDERAAIDEARIRRQQSSEGTWRREWDNEKSDTQRQEQQPQQQQPPNFRGGSGGSWRGRGGPPAPGGFRGQQRGGNGTKVFYPRGRGNNQPQGGENNFQNDKWVREAPPAHEGSNDGPPGRDLRDIINSKRTGQESGAGRGGFGGTKFDQPPKPRREPSFKGSNRQEHNDDEWEDVE